MDEVEGWWEKATEFSTSTEFADFGGGGGEDFGCFVCFEYVYIYLIYTYTYLNKGHGNIGGFCYVFF